MATVLKSIPKVKESIARVTHGVAVISRLLKIIDSFAEYSLFYGALSQKRRIILKNTLIVATP